MLRGRIVVSPEDLTRVLSRYIFRHNRAIFWTVRDQIPEYIGNNVFVRFAMGWMFPPLVTFLKLPATPSIKHEMMNHRVYQVHSAHPYFDRKLPYLE